MRLSKRVMLLSSKAARIFQGKDEPNQLSSGMRDGDIVVLTFRTLLGKIGGKG